MVAYLCVCVCVSLPPSSSAVQPVAHVSDLGCIVAQVLRVPPDQHAAEQRWHPQAPPRHAAGHLATKGRTTVTGGF